MKFILLIITTFHFEAQPATQQIEFNSRAECEVAVVHIKEAFIDTERERGGGWGHRRLVAVCLKKSLTEEQK